MDAAPSAGHEPFRAGVAGKGKGADPAGKSGILCKRSAGNADAAARRAGGAAPGCGAGAHELAEHRVHPI